MNRKLFFVGLILAASGLLPPPLALLGGLVYGLSLAHPFHIESKSLAKFLLQASVVGLGFGMNLHEVIQAGRSGFLYTAVSITAAMLLGLGLGYLIHVSKKASFLISAGTAICGGSAIAAVGPIAGANEEEMAVSLGAVFILNSVALFLFPLIGFALHMSQAQFGLWSALAIHDTSSVVGATARYGSAALAVGTTVKLARALWIVPLSLITAAILKSKSRIQWPWFIPGADFSAGVRRAQSSWQNRTYRDSLPDRHRAQQTNTLEGRLSPPLARTGPVGCCGRFNTRAHSLRLYSALEATRGVPASSSVAAVKPRARCAVLPSTIPIAL